MKLEVNLKAAIENQQNMNNLLTFNSVGDIRFTSKSLVMRFKDGKSDDPILKQYFAAYICCDVKYHVPSTSSILLVL